jgi:hypothetical protein
MKPVVFFSHSSQDREAILPIRDRLVEGSAHAVQVFMASDGASIPFGRNWLKEIEDALAACKLMFVWMTPTSLASKWIPFESGYAYSRGIRVVPIGFQGVRLDDLPAPISILQGFNVTGSQGLNNIVAIINEEFGLTLPDLFDEEFYVANVADVTSEDSAELLRFVRVIRCEFMSTTSASGETSHVRSDWRSVARDSLVQLGIPFSDRGESILGIGFRIQETTRAPEKPRVMASIDPIALNSTREAWSLLRDRFYDRQLPYTGYVPQLVEGMELPDDVSLVGSRLLKSEVGFDTEFPHELYRFRNILFRIDVSDHREEATKDLVLLVPRENAQPIPLLSLLKLLEERRILERGERSS